VTTPLLRLPRIGADALDVVKRLSGRLDLANVEYDRVDRYYTGDQPLKFMPPEVVAQLGERLSPLVINWPETVVDSVTRRLSVEGFRIGQGGEADDEMWRIYTANELEEESPLGISDALVHGLAYLSVWGNQDDSQTPVISFESAHQVTVEYDPGNRTVRAALKRWTDGTDTFVTLYTRTEVVRYAAVRMLGGTVSSYEIDQVLPNPLGAVPIVPMVNRGRLLNRNGRSELESVAPIADGINALFTDMMTTADFYVTPRRYVTGMQVSSDPGQRERLQAEVAAYWERAIKSKMLVAGEGVEFGQFPEATLDGFVKGINALTSALAAIAGLPPDDLGLHTTNPASAEARRAAETTLILRAKEKQRAFGAAYVKAMRLAIASRDGTALADVPQEFSRMQVAWADPATPAIAQAMDAAVKGKEAGIYDVEAAQEQVGMSPVERAAVKQRAAEATFAAATSDIRARMDLARELSGTDVPLSPNAALAAAGLLQAASTNSADRAPSTPA